MNLDDNKYYQEALKFIADNDLGELEPGKHIITSDPDTAHAPLIGEGQSHKVIFKVRVA